jgi:two-component system alkaline phosphatase synthesis response regulator PhoP
MMSNPANDRVGPRHKVLVADDDKAMLHAISVRLESLGYDVVQAEDAYQAYALALQERPDVLLLDVHLPAGDGFSIQKRLAQSDDFDPASVIYITGSVREDVEPVARDLEAHGVLFKPFCSADLAAAVRDAVGPRAPAG